MKRKFKLIVPSFLTLIFCLLLIAGSTFAIFSSQDEASIAVTSGKVDLKAVLTDMHAYSVEATDEEGDAGSAEAFGVTSNYKYVARDQVNDSNHYVFSTGGTAALESNALTLNKIVPGDRVTINLRLENYSNVITKYRLKVTAQEAADNTGLLEGLEINITKGLVTKQLKGVIRVDAWEELPAVTGDDPDVINVGIEVVLPITAGNEYQDLKAKLRFTVEAVQGNAKTDDTLDHVNAYLAEQSLTAEGPNKTMYDAIVDANEYIADHTTETFDATKYLWNIDTDQFYDPSNVVAGFESRYFKAYAQDDMPTKANQTYNIYATGAWTNVDEDYPVEIAVGFDAGEATGISHISYVRNSGSDKARETIIRTNDVNATLTVDAPKDKVYHYGLAGLIDIIAAANASYHEFGTVGFVKIAKGRIAIEENSNVSQVHIKTSELTSEQTSQVETTFDEIIVSIAAPEVKPTFSRDDVEIADGGTLVVALQQGTEDVTEETELDYVWLTKQGIYEQIKVSDNSESAGNVWVNTSDKPATTKTAANEIANNITRDNNGDIQVQATVTKTVDTVVTTKTYEVKLDANRDLIVVDTEDQQATQTVVATLNDKTTNVEVGNDTFTVALSSTNDNVTQIVLTNTAPESEEVIKSEGKITSSGLDENAQQAAMNENNYKNASIRNRIQQKAYSSLKQALAEVDYYDIIDIVGSVKVSEEATLTKYFVEINLNEGSTLEFVDAGKVNIVRQPTTQAMVTFLRGTGTIKNSTDHLIFCHSANNIEVIDIDDIHVEGDLFSDCKLNIYSGYFNTKFYDDGYVCNNENSYFNGGYFTDENMSKFAHHGAIGEGTEEYPYYITPESQNDIQIIYADKNRGSLMPTSVASPTLWRKYSTDALDSTLKFLNDFTASNLHISSYLYNDVVRTTIDLNNHTYTFTGSEAFTVWGNKMTIKNGTIIANGSNQKMINMYSTPALRNDVTIQNVTFSNSLLSDILDYLREGDYVVMNGNGTFTVTQTAPTNCPAMIERSGINLCYQTVADAVASLQRLDVLHLYEAYTSQIALENNVMVDVVLEGNFEFPEVVAVDSENAELIVSEIAVNQKRYEAKLDYAIIVYNGDELLKGYKLTTDLSTAISYVGSNGYRLVLQKDLSLSNYITLGSQRCTIDLNGHKISSSGTVFRGRFGLGNPIYYINIEDNSLEKTGMIESESGYLFYFTGNSIKNFISSHNTGNINIYGGTLKSSGSAVYYDYPDNGDQTRSINNFVWLNIYGGAVLANGDFAARVHPENQYWALNVVLNNAYSRNRTINVFGGAIIAGSGLEGLLSGPYSNAYVRVATDSTTYTPTVLLEYELEGYDNCYIASEVAPAS